MEPRTAYPVFFATLSENEKETGIFALSFVDDPAVEKHFVALAKQGKPHPVRLSFDKMKKVVTGPVLIPDKSIFRNAIPEQGIPPHYIRFSKGEIVNISRRLMKTGIALHSTTHQHETPLKNNYLVELWIIEDPARDKSAALGFTDLPVGTLMASVKIEDDAYWTNEVMTGNVKGFSLEGFFLYNNLNMFKKTKKAAQLAKAPKKGVVFSLSVDGHTVKLESETAAEAEEMAAVVENDETDSGTVVTIFELSEGGEIHIMSDGSATKDGESVPAGNYPLTDGATLVIDEEGNFSLTTDTPEDADPAEAEVALKKARDNGKAIVAQVLKAAKTPKGLTVEQRLAKAEAEVARLKATPSTTPAVQPIEVATSTFEGRIATGLKAARARRGLE